MNNKIQQLLKSGNFTIAYHDNGDCQLYKGKHEYDDLPAKGFEFNPNLEHGYAPPEVVALVEALGGKIESI